METLPRITLSRAEMMQRIVATLAQGIPVTLKMGDRPLMTFYPGGKIEQHEWTGVKW